MTGTVAQLHRWPVKSMAGEPVQALKIDGRGAAGDRTHAIWHRHKGEDKRLTARESPRLLAWRASYDGAELDPAQPPAPLLTAPDGTRYAWDDPDLPAALSHDLGRDIWLHSDPRGQQDLPDSLLITTRASLDALRAELDLPLDLRRFRTNLHLVLDEIPPYAEHAWEGRTLVAGDARLQLLHPCERCAIPTRDPDDQTKLAVLLRHLTRYHDQLFGINARPLAPARIAVGDAVAFA